VSAIELRAIGQAQFAENAQLALVGVPAESVVNLGTDRQLKFLLVPLSPFVDGDLPVKGDTILATMADNPTEPLHSVNNIQG